MRIIFILFISLLIGCSSSIQTTTMTPKQSSALDEFFNDVKPVTQQSTPEPEKIIPQPIIIPPETIQVALIDFDSIYNNAPALIRLRANLNNYKPAIELMSLVDSTSPEAIKRKNILKIQVKSKMTAIVYDCKNLIHQTIQNQYNSTFKIICDKSGKSLVAEEFATSKLPDKAFIVQTNITQPIIIALQ